MDSINQISKIFFPPVQQDSTEMTLKTAMDKLQTQRIARVVKAAFFTLSSSAATFALVLTEAAVITWSLAIPAILVTVVAGVIFYRLNSLDETYIEGLTDDKRESLAKQELERIFLGKELFSNSEIRQSLLDINRLLEMEFFDKKLISDILSLQTQARSVAKSLAEVAFEQQKPIAISLGSEWKEHGHFGLPSYNHTAGLSWSGNPNDPINVTCKKTG